MATIIHIITGLNDGGAEAVLYRLCTNDNSTQHQVISLMDMGKYGPLLVSKGMKVTCLGMPQGRVTLTGLWKLYRLLCNERPEVVQTWMYHADLIGGIAARFAKVKNVFWNVRHSVLDRAYSKRSTLFVARACALLSHFVPTKIIFCANSALSIHRSLGYNSKKLTVIPNGYDLSELIVDQQAGWLWRQKFNVGDRHLLGMVGRFDPAKDHWTLLSALAELRDRGVNFLAVLVGRDIHSDNAQLGAWISQFSLQESVLLLGQRTDVPDIMNALDIHVLSSSSEAFPNVVAEAMACGTPVVTTDVGDAAFIVGDVGWVVPPGDSLALAHALQQALALPDMRRSEIGQLARQRVATSFSLEGMVAAYHRVWTIQG